MASTSKSNGSELVKNLSAFKRKIRDNESAVEIDKRSKYWEDSDDEPLIPGVLVRVEVEEVDEPGSPLDFSTSKKGSSSTSKQGKTSKRSRRYTCLECSAVFKRAPDLKAHAVEHQIETRHKCQTCGRCFSRAFSLKMHQRVHVKDEKCPFCELTFALRVNLNRHIIRSHDATLQCDECPNKFHTNEQLEKHKASHAAGSSIQESGDSENGETQNPENQSSDSENERNSDKEFLPTSHTGNSSNDNNSNDQEYKPDMSNNMFTQIILTPDELSGPIKYAIVCKMQKGKLVPELCKQYNTTEDVINSIWEDREMYMLPKQEGKKSIKYMNSVLDKQILEWYKNEKDRNVQVTGKMLQDRAEKFAQESGFVAFNPSKKWLERFKKRYNIQFRPPNVNRDYHAIESKWKTLFFKEQWPDARGGIADEDIYTADEVGLFFNPSKGRIRKYGGRRYVQGYVKDRLSIFMCTNVNGTDKKKLLVCGSEDPLVHSYRDPSTLPVMYIRHGQAQFTTRIFEEYVKFWNRELQLMNRRALLLLDRATIHSKLQLSHLKLVFVPWKSNANSLMPVKNGIFTRFREEFKRLLLQEKAMNVVRGIDRNLTCLEALNMLEKAWNRIPPDVIFKGFVTPGYDIQNCKKNNAVVYTPKILENDAEVISKMLIDYDVETYFTDLSSLDMYLTVDDELLTGQGTNVSVFGGNRKPIQPGTSKQVPPVVNDVDDALLPLNTEKPESEKTEIIVRRTRAFEDLNIIRYYLQSNSTSYETFCSFMDIEKYLLNSNFNVL